MLYSTQCTQVIFGAAGSGASGSSTISTRLLVAGGIPDQPSCGETSLPSQVFMLGIGPPATKSVDVKVMLMAIASSPTSIHPAAAHSAAPPRHLVNCVNCIL